MTGELGQCSRSVVHGRGSWPCNRPATEVLEGRPMCKLHAAGHRRSLAQRAKRDAEWEASNRRNDELLATAKAVSRHTGLDVHATFDHYGRGLNYTGGFDIHFDDEEALRAFLRKVSLELGRQA